MFKRTYVREQGFTLIELLIVVAIIGLLAAMLVPNMLDALQKAKQKRTMADQRMVGTGMMAWLTDHSSSAAAGQSGNFSMDNYTMVELSEVVTELVPQYMQSIPEKDGWNYTFEYHLNINQADAPQVMAVRSFGRDGVADGDVYTAGGYLSSEYDKDIVWADGFFVRWPSGLDVAN
ncbi:MAG: type II secretion system GspH family protein [Deltaproteobacteria bacterium]|nr:type II secretion system GspH family protein [Deltaproteobacteria bacterium]